MMEVINHGVYLVDGRTLVDGTPAEQQAQLASMGVTAGSRNDTIAYGILNAHNVAKDENGMQIRFDALISHDITYVGIIQTARASGLKQFPIPYALTNCHNSL